MDVADGILVADQKGIAGVAAVFEGDIGAVVGTVVVAGIAVGTVAAGIAVAAHRSLGFGIDCSS